MGGSQGAAALNLWAEEASPVLAQQRIQLLCLTGGRESVRRIVHYDADGEETSGQFIGFSDDMADVLSAADLVVSRSGAGSIAELKRCRVPAVLVPYPLSADGHQDANAENFVSLGCGESIDQDELSNLLPTVLEIFGDPQRMRRYQERLALADPVDVPGEIAADLDEISAGRLRNRAQAAHG